jgi:hypothetical protein
MGGLFILNERGENMTICIPGWVIYGLKVVGLIAGLWLAAIAVMCIVAFLAWFKL